MRGDIVQFRQAITALPVQRQGRGTCKKKKKKFTLPLAEKLNPLPVWSVHHGCIRRHIALCHTARGCAVYDGMNTAGVKAFIAKAESVCTHVTIKHTAQWHSVCLRWAPWTTHGFPSLHLYARGCCEDVLFYIIWCAVEWMQAKPPKEKTRVEKQKPESTVYTSMTCACISTAWMGLGETLRCI